MRLISVVAAKPRRGLDVKEEAESKSHLHLGI
jgi:hypothetical protein